MNKNSRVTKMVFEIVVVKNNNSKTLQKQFICKVKGNECDYIVENIMTNEMLISYLSYCKIFVSRFCLSGKYYVDGRRI